MKTAFRITLILSILALAALACQLSPSASANSSGTNSVLFQDDFSNSKNGWDSMDEADSGSTDYANSGYRIFVSRSNYYLWGNPTKAKQLPGDVRVEVDVTKTAGPDENDMGIICRYQDENNFYFLTAGSDGYYGISKIINGDESLIGMDSMQLDKTNIKMGDATNHLEADCVGNKLSLYVNGKLLAQAQDSDLTGGTVGLLAGSYDTSGVDILFDNFVVSKP